MENQYQYSDLAIDDFKMDRVTISKFRDAILNDRLTSGPGANKVYMPTIQELDAILTQAKEAVKAGRVILFGTWPNEFIINTGLRAKPLYRECALGHPFAEPWVMIHQWTDPKMAAKYGIELDCSAYLIRPYADKSVLGCDFEACTIEGFIVRNLFVLGVGDRVVVHTMPGDNRGFYCSVASTAMRFQHVLDTSDYTDEVAISNVLDPVMTALMILNTRGVQQETVTVSPKLNKARLRSNRPPIPPYQSVKDREYVTAITARKERQESRGTGTHASPIPHVRHGHWRNYQSGHRSFIRDTLVNVSEATREQFISSRSHYNVKDTLD